MRLTNHDTSALVSVNGRAPVAIGGGESNKLGHAKIVLTRCLLGLEHADQFHSFAANETIPDLCPAPSTMGIVQ